MNSEKKERDILTIMEMFGIEFSQAAGIYSKQNQNMENVISQLLKKQSNSQQTSENLICRKGETNINQQKQRLSSGSIHVQKMREMHRQSQQKQIQLTAEQARQRFKTNYLIKKKSTYKRLKQQVQDQMLIKLKKYLNQTITVNFLQENNDIFNELWNTRKFIAVHCLSIPQIINPKDIQEEIKKNYYTQIYCSQKFGTIFNKEFLNIIVDPTSYNFGHLKVINQFIKSKDINCIVILRVHQKTKMIVRAYSMNMVSCIKPQNPESFQKHLIHVRRDINREIQMEICPSIHHNPLSDIQKIKLDGDRKIKAQQETAYKMMEQQLREAKKIQNQQEPQINKKQLKRKRNSESQDEEIKRMKEQVMKSVQQSIIKQRQQKLKQMKKYTPQEIQNPITLKIRFPNGKQIHLVLPKNETLQYVVAYITCQQQTLGFQNQLRRNFVLTQPWISTDFNDMQNKTILELFPESNGEILIVKQIQ